MSGSESVADLKDKVERLEEELSDMRSVILYLLPRRYGRLLYSYKKCNTREELVEWRKAIVNQVMDELEKDNTIQEGFGAKWTRCPLCDFADIESGENTYRYPIGFERHLRGSHGAGKCVVMQIVREITVEFSRENFEKNNL